MEKVDFILGNIYRLHLLAGRILDEAGNTMAFPYTGFQEQDPVSNSPKLRKMLMCAGEQTTDENRDVYSVFNDDGYWYYVFHGMGCYVIWGPVVFEEHTRHEQRAYGNSRGVEGKICELLFANIREVEGTIVFAHGLLFEKYGEETVFSRGMADEWIQKDLIAELSEYGLEKAEYKREHYTFSREQQMWKWFVEGKGDKEKWESLQMDVEHLFEDVVKGVGIMSAWQEPEKPRLSRNWRTGLG